MKVAGAESLQQAVVQGRLEQAARELAKLEPEAAAKLSMACLMRRSVNCSGPYPSNWRRT